APVAGPVGWSRGLVGLLSVACVVAMIAALAWIFLRGDGGLTVVQDRRPSVAVLPFRASTESDADAWLGEGVADDIIMALSRFRDIAVIARNTSFRFDDSDELS